MADYLNMKDYSEYYSLFGIKPDLSGNPLSLIKHLMDRKKTIILSDNIAIRGVGKLFGLQRAKLSEERIRVGNHFAFIDALNVLNKKGVKVYFYNRVGKKKD